MKNLTSLVLLSSIYSLSIVLGFYTALFILPLMYPPDGGEPVLKPAVDDPQSLSSTAYFFASILVMTLVMLLLLKFKAGYIIRAALFISFFTGTLFTFTAFFGDAGILFPIVASILLLLRVKSDIFYNLLLVFTTSGIGAVLGASLGVVPALALAVIMSVYDFVAVFLTKHMVSLAKEAQGKYPLMFMVPVGDRVMSLGAGDIALPLTLSVSVLASQGLFYALPCAMGGLIGLASLFNYIDSRRGATLPALPPIVGGQILGLGIAVMVKSIV